MTLKYISLIGFFLVCMADLVGQNLIRNGGFEGPNLWIKPNAVAQLNQWCRRWKEFDGSSSDWFRDEDAHLRGGTDLQSHWGRT